MATGAALGQVAAVFDGRCGLDRGDVRGMRVHVQAVCKRRLAEQEQHADQRSGQRRRHDAVDGWA